MNVELMLLTVLQGLRTQILDAGMLFFTHLGDAGFIWAALTAVLLVFRRTRRVGCVLAGGTPRRCCSLQPHSQAAGGPHPPL